jgi:peptide-methionine (S)-S-oxide reductase
MEDRQVLSNERYKASARDRTGVRGPAKPLSIFTCRPPFRLLSITPIDDNELMETITLGGGCFWCLEAVYVEMEGVTSVVSGYMGGRVPDPDYRSVCTGATGHIEVVQVTFDPAITSTREILEVFFAIHDPTSMDRQGNDAGTQYRSAIFYHTQEQYETAQALIDELESEKIWSRPIVTEVRPAVEFYPAEDYHQNYFANNPQQPYCSFVVSPKVRKFREKFAAKMRKGA